MINILSFCKLDVTILIRVNYLFNQLQLKPVKMIFSSLLMRINVVQFGCVTTKLNYCEISGGKVFVFGLYRVDHK